MIVALGKTDVARANRPNRNVHTNAKGNWDALFEPTAVVYYALPGGGEGEADQGPPLTRCATSTRSGRLGRWVTTDRAWTVERLKEGLA